MRKISILIVEDEPIIAADLQDRLEEMGYEVLGHFTSGEQVLQWIDGARRLPDLILMDINLEGALNGVETMRLLQKQHRLQVIFLTSNSDEHTFEEARAVHPRAFLTKPFKGRDLKYAIELALSHPEPPEIPKSDEMLIMEDRMFIKVKDRMIRLYYEDILWVVADDYYCRVVTKDREHLVTQTLKRLQEELAMQKFIFRVHRSYLVNIRHITEIGESFLFVGQHQIPLNKSAKEELMARLKKI